MLEGITLIFEGNGYVNPSIQTFGLKKQSVRMNETSLNQQSRPKGRGMLVI